jgi:hypothetical protein
MKLLREYIRELLKESVDPKIMSMIDQADKAGYYVQIGDGFVAIVDRSKNSQIAEISWDDEPDYGPCLNGSYVQGANAQGGFGPLAYDVAMEATGGLMSDRTEVSGEAERVWSYYLNNRADVQSQQLDIMPDYLEPQLTPDDESDDCEQIPAYDTLKGKWHTSPLSKKYSKAGTPVMDELRRRGMLYE